MLLIVQPDGKTFRVDTTYANPLANVVTIKDAFQPGVFDETDDPPYGDFISSNNGDRYFRHSNGDVKKYCFDCYGNSGGLDDIFGVHTFTAVGNQHQPVFTITDGTESIFEVRNNEVGILCPLVVMAESGNSSSPSFEVRTHDNRQLLNVRNESTGHNLTMRLGGTYVFQVNVALSETDLRLRTNLIPDSTETVGTSSDPFEEIYGTTLWTDQYIRGTAGSSLHDYIRFANSGYVTLQANSQLTLRGGPSANHIWQMNGTYFGPSQWDAGMGF